MAGEELGKVLQDGFDAFTRGDMDFLRTNTFTENTVWHVAGNGPLSGDYTGDQVFGWFGKLFEMSGGTFKVDVHDIATSDQHVVGITTVSAERGGKRLENVKGVEIHHFEGGKISESWLMNENQEEFDEFWA